MKEHILPTLLENLTKYPQDQWLELLKQAVEEQAQVFEDISITYVLNPSVCNCFRICSTHLRTIKRAAEVEETLSQKYLEREKEMGVTR